jgi:hypothetical protein
MSNRFCIKVGASAALALACAAYAQPANDNCASATAASLGDTAWDNTNATTDGSASCGFGGNTGTADVWYTFTPAASDNYFLSTCTGGTIGDTLLSVYDSCGGSEIACNDDFCGLLSRVAMPMTAGTTYYIRVAEWALTPIFGSGTLTIIQAPPAPANDLCAAAVAITLGSPISIDNTGATEDGAASCGFGGSAGFHDIWYSFTAPAAGCFNFSTCGGTLDTIVSVFDSCGGTEIGCDDDFCGFASGSTARAVLTAGQSVRVRVAGWGTADEGQTTLEVTQGVVPANDLCANAIALTVGTPVAFDNSCSGTEGASSCGFGGDPGANDIWYSFTAPATGPFRVDTCQSGGLDTQLSVYDSCGGSEIACNDDACALSSAVTINATSGTTYIIRLAGWQGTQGAGTLNVSVPAANDVCTGTLPVVTVGSTPTDTTNANNDDATNCGGGGPEIFYSFTPAASGGYQIDMCGSSYDTMLGVLMADCVTEIACNDDSACGGTFTLQSTVTPFLTGGTTYIIQVDGFGAAFGTGTLNITGPIGGPANDLCANATTAVVGGNPFNNQFAGNEGSASCGFGGNTGDADVWFSFTAPATQDYRLDTCGSFDTLLSVYDSCGGSEIACNDDSCGLSSALTLSTTAGVNYRIRVASWAPGAAGAGTLTITSLVSGGDYTACDSAGVFEDISSTGTNAATVSNCDDCFEAIPIGFSFNFYGAAFTDAQVSSNGLMAFGAGSAVFGNVAIPNAAIPNNFASALWDDLYPTGAGDIYYQTTGTAGSRVFTVSWQGVAPFPTTNPEYNFQVHLYEGSNNIEFRYGSITPDVGGDYTIGVEDATGLFGTAIDSATIGSGNTARFLIPPGGSCPGACDSVDFNGDTLFPDTQDITDFIFVFGGGTCPTGTCGDLDFNNDGLLPDTMDIQALISVFAGGPCIR